jgi:sulfite oxidase
MTPAVSRRRFLELAGGAALASSWGCRAAPRATPDAPELIARQETPYNAEPALEKLVESWITPLRHFYIRRHGPVPAVDASAWTLSVEGLVGRPLRLGLDRMRGDFLRATVPAALQCAGNRRGEHSRVKKVGGVQWDAGAIGNAEWSGVRLGDLLKAAGVKSSARHVCFTALDDCAVPGGKSPFGASIPIEKALAPETLVALEMNGAALTAEHGFPARTLVPGYVGARSVKWLGSIVVSEKPSDNFFHARDYKLFPPEVTAETAKWDEAPALGEMPTNSAICSPMAGQTVKAGAVRVRGYALAATGRSVAKVEVSADGGASWAGARLSGGGAPFGWVLWEAEVAARPGALALAVRATDSSGAVQPERAPWNFKGYLNNSWHRVDVAVS